MIVSCLGGVAYAEYLDRVAGFYLLFSGRRCASKRVVKAVATVVR